MSYTFPGEVRVGLSMSENRSQRGLTRAVISEDVISEAVVRDTMVSAELSKTRGTSMSSSVEFDSRAIQDQESRLVRSERAHQHRQRGPRLKQPLLRERPPLSENFSWDASLSGKLIEKLVVNTSVPVQGQRCAQAGGAGA